MWYRSDVSGKKVIVLNGQEITEVGPEASHTTELVVLEANDLDITGGSDYYQKIKCRLLSLWLTISKSLSSKFDMNIQGLSLTIISVFD